ncbi:MAG: ABC transporter permease [Candidatus Zixiibacteriota bacterium]
MLSNKGLEKVQDLGIVHGFPNMLKKELGFWFGKSKIGIIISIFSLIIVNAILAFSLWMPENPIPENGSSAMLPILSTLVFFVAIIMLLGSIIGEDKMGTSEWVMSKPITRESYILSKIVGNWLGIFITVVIIQTIFGLIHTLIASGGIPNLLYLSEGIALIGLKLLFFVSLMIFLGTLLQSRAAILAIIFFLAVIQMILTNQLNKVNQWLPLLLPNKFNPLIQSFGLGQRTPFDMWYLPMISVAFLTGVCIVLSILLFKRKEF